MKSVAKVMAVVMVLAAALTFNSSALMAAHTHGVAIAAERSAGFGLFQTILRLLGFVSGDLGNNDARAHQTLHPVLGAGGSATGGGFSSQPSNGLRPDVAVWGRCTLPPC